MSSNQGRTRRGLFSRNAWLGVACGLALAVASTGCGGGGGGGGGNFAAKPMVLVQFLFVDRALQPSFPTGVQALPRNAQLIFEFSEQVDPDSVNQQSISIRAGPTFLSLPKGSFQVDGNRVIFDPTVTSQGTPNPFGFDPATQYNVELPSEGETNNVVRNRDNDPLLTPFFTTFTTSDGFLRELVPPQVLRAFFIPEPDPLTKQIPGDGLLGLEFSEAMDPKSFVLATQVPTVNDGIDIRYNDLPDPNINQANSKEGRVIEGSFTWTPDAKTFFFTPAFSFGDNNYIFSVIVTQKLTDLSGNPLINPRSFGPFTSDGSGKIDGVILAESFDTTVDNDVTVTNGDWGFTTPGELQGAAITFRRVAISSYVFAENEQGGQYNPIVDPLTGESLNLFLTGINPPTNQGRRVMWAISDGELGPNGSITTASWGPDSNATFAATYQDVILRVGYQKQADLSLAATFSGNYASSPLIIYKGKYTVGQAANVGDEFPIPTNTTPYASLDPLYNFQGFVNWPAVSSYFDWDQGDPSVDMDSVLVFDASVIGGDVFQQIRGWFAVTAPGSGVLIGAWPTRRMYATYEEDTPNPQTNFGLGVINPEPSWTDSAFTITKRVSLAQSRFYTPPQIGADSVLGYTDPTFPYSSQNTFGAKSNYKAALLVPAIQAGGAQILIEYQGAALVDGTSQRTVVNGAKPSTPFTTNINDCDTFGFLRWRITLTSNLISNSVAKLQKIAIPIERLP